jgi:hypothetical protein
VKDGDGMACGQQAADDIRPDEAGAAADENLHVSSPWRLLDAVCHPGLRGAFQPPCFAAFTE